MRSGRERHAHTSDLPSRGRSASIPPSSAFPAGREAPRPVTARPARPKRRQRAALRQRMPVGVVAMVLLLTAWLSADGVPASEPGQLNESLLTITETVEAPPSPAPKSEDVRPAPPPSAKTEASPAARAEEPGEAEARGGVRQAGDLHSAAGSGGARPTEDEDPQAADEDCAEAEPTEEEAPPPPQVHRPPQLGRLPGASRTRASWMCLPGPSSAAGVPNFIIRKFRVPPFLLPIYQAAGIEYGIRWEVLAAINEIETDYGRNLNVSSAGAVGWMQFIPSTWRMYGTDANEDGRKDPYNPVDAIFAAARYLSAAGYEDDVRRAMFAYNHADWYVDSVLLRARLIAGVPADLVGSLTGLTEGRFPVYARARYADDQAEGMDASRGIGIFAERGRARRGGERRRDPQGRPRASGSGSTWCSRTPTATASPTRTSARCRASTPCRRATARRRSRPMKARREAIRRPPPRPPRAASPILRLSPRMRLRRLRRPTTPTRLAAGEGAPLRPSGRPRGEGGGRPGADARRARAQERQVRDLRRLLLAPDPPRPLEGAPAPPPGGLARDRRHGARAAWGARPPAAAHGCPSRSGRPGRARRRSTRSRSSTAGSCSRPPPSTAPRAATSSTQEGRLGLGRPGAAVAEAAARAPGALGRAHRDLRLRPRRHQVRPGGPARARHARVPGRVRAEPDRHEPQVRPRLLHRAPATSRSTAPAAPWTSRRSTASRSSATRRPAA